MSQSLRETARAILDAALKAVDVRGAVSRRIRISEMHLQLGDRTVPRVDFDRVLIVAMGKAAMPMYEAAVQALNGLTVDAVVVAPQETLPAEPSAWMLPGAHPTPDLRSLVAADAILPLLRSATKRDVVLFLISGGASAMVERPLSEAISLEDMARFHQALVGSGLPITQMNALRKRLSAVKGGRLAEVAGAALAQHTLLVSDVPAASPDAVASGPSLPDPSTREECRRLMASLADVDLPATVRAFLTQDAVPETPKYGDAAFARSTWEVILSMEHLARAAAEAARALGFHAVVENSCDDWDYRDAARLLLDRSAALARNHPATCLVSVGEVGVTLEGTTGTGGRNQQFALHAAQEITRRSMCAAVLSVGTDGVDGNSPAAGAVCDETTVRRARSLGYSTQEALLRFDSMPLLRVLGDAVFKGPTGNNLRDLRLVLTQR